MTEQRLPQPLPAERERLIIIEILDGHADTTIVHLPPSAPSSPGRAAHHAGVLADVPVCADCEAAA